MDHNHSETSRANWIDRAIGERLHTLRKESGVTQEELARRLSISFQQIQKYEKGANRISASRLFMIAKALQVPYDLFFNGWDKEKSYLLGEEKEDYNTHPLKETEKNEILNFFSEIPSERARSTLLQGLRDLSRSLRQ